MNTCDATSESSANPLLQEWTGLDGAPPFELIRPEHFEPAFARAFADHEAEVAGIAGNPAEPTFDNTIAALELSGRCLNRTNDVFRALAI
jgi:peptidyl-dipeptidase Dcp